MSRKYKFREKSGAYFISFAIVNWIEKLADEQYSKGRQSINDLNFAKAYGFYKNGVKIELVKDYTRLGLHAIGVISNILNCD
ncbi:MAG: hypothetical protein ACKVIG_05735 [Flavobacteriales bacterium]